MTGETLELWGDILSGGSNACRETVDTNTHGERFPFGCEVGTRATWVPGFGTLGSRIQTRDAPMAQSQSGLHSMMFHTQSTITQLTNVLVEFRAFRAQRFGSTVPTHIESLTSVDNETRPHPGADTCAEDFIPLPDMTSEFDASSPSHLSGLATPLRSSPREFFTPLASPPKTPTCSGVMDDEVGPQVFDVVAINQFFELPNVKPTPGHHLSTIITHRNKPSSDLTDLEIFPEPSNAKEADIYSSSSLSDPESIDIEVIEVKRMTRSNSAKATTPAPRRGYSRVTATPTPVAKATLGTLRSTRRTTIMTGVGLTEEERMAEIVRQARLESNTSGGDGPECPANSSRKPGTRSGGSPDANRRWKWYIK